MMNRSTVILIASVALNVFLIGVGIGVVVTGAKITSPGAVRNKPPNIWMAAQALPQPDRFKFRGMLRERAAAVQPQLKSVRAARLEAAALMAEPTFDPDATGDALERARNGEAAARAEFDQAFIAYLTGMPRSERAALADAMARAGPRNVRDAVKEGDAATMLSASPAPAEQIQR
jgi:uncharacterized membrane protein